MSSIRGRLSGQFVEHGTGSKVEQVEKEVVRVDDVDLVGIGALGREVAQVERDQQGGPDRTAAAST